MTAPPLQIAGCDASTKRIGWADPSGHLWSLTAHAGAQDPARRLHELLRHVERTIRLRPPLPHLVAVEGYSYGSPGALSLIRLGEIGGCLRLRLFELGIGYVEIPPASVKRYATGNGNADKARMIAAAQTAGAAPANDDEADAYWLRRMARAAYGLDPVDHQHETDALAAIGWPTDVSLRRSSRPDGGPVV